MKRGEVWWVDFEPAIGGEIKKTRPAVILSIDEANASLNRVQVVPLTSNTGRLYPSETIINFDDKKGKVMADQITTAAKERLRKKMGVISPQEMKELEKVVRLQLGL